MASKLLHFVSLTDWFIMLGAKLLNSILHVNRQQLNGPVFLSGLSRNGPQNNDLGAASQTLIGTLRSEDGDGSENIV